jgi:peptidoglycan lytic transglycosylase G
MSEGTNSEQAERPRRTWSCLKLVLKACLFLLVLLILLACGAGIGTYFVYEHVTQPGVAGEVRRVTIPQGVTGKAIGDILEREGLVEYEAFFRIALKLDKAGRPLKHGEYELPKGLSPLELLHLLQEGPDWRFDPDKIPDDQKVSVPEGLSLVQAAALFGDPKAFEQAASDQALLMRLGVEADSLEGFLMPKTYFFDHKPTERDVVERMVAQFEKEYALLASEIPDAKDPDLLRTVTVASLVEEEARIDEERATIAAVIYNRLDRKMALELDSTLQYALGKYGERMLYEDKEVDSPYNTYKHAGLPPGPISSPGTACLRAALAPADVDYLFFVSNADGKTHTFSRTMAEHTRAVKRYRREMSEKRAEQRKRQD